jgi:hypothetical protein
MAGLMGNVEDYHIDFSRNEVGNTNNRVNSINWNSQGHASILMDYNSPELWTFINNWIKNN